MHTFLAVYTRYLHLYRLVGKNLFTTFLEWAFRLGEFSLASNLPAVAIICKKSQTARPDGILIIFQFIHSGTMTTMSTTMLSPHSHELPFERQSLILFFANSFFILSLFFAESNCQTA